MASSVYDLFKVGIAPIDAPIGGRRLLASRFAPSLNETNLRNRSVPLGAICKVCAELLSNATVLTSMTYCPYSPDEKIIGANVEWNVSLNQSESRPVSRGQLHREQTQKAGVAE